MNSFLQNIKYLAILVIVSRISLRHGSTMFHYIYKQLYNKKILSKDRYNNY